MMSSWLDLKNHKGGENCGVINVSNIFFTLLRLYKKNDAFAEDIARIIIKQCPYNPRTCELQLNP